MIITQLHGGLGNQLFQYAAGRAVALRTGSLLKLDLSRLGRAYQRPYQLDLFRLEIPAATQKELPFAFRQPYWSQSKRRLIAHLPRRAVEVLSRRPAVIREAGFRFDPQVTLLTGDVYLVGFWQSYRYFEDVAEVIRTDLALSATDAGVDPAAADEVAREGSVSLHVRRQDYVNHPAMRPLDPSYYRRALEMVAATADVRHVYVFSDDIGWALRELSIDLPVTFVSETQSRTARADFFLMSRCHHHVIANSSFSWWAAWLGADRVGVVVSPRDWFRDPAVDTSDLRPPSWHVV